MGETMPRPRRKRRNAVFVEDFVDLPCPITDIPQQLLGSAAWLTRLANAAEDDGETLRLRIGPTWVGGRIKREVEVSASSERARGRQRSSCRSRGNPFATPRSFRFLKEIWNSHR